MSRKNKTPFTILGMLSIRPMTGYDVKKMIEKTTSNIWSESLGQIYPALALLEKQGKIIVVKSKSNNGRKRKEYKITAKGTKTLQEWLPMPAEQRVFRDELMLKLFFGKNMSKEECLKHIQQRKIMAEQALTSYKTIEYHLKNEHTNEADTTFWLLTLRAGIYSADAALAWCDEAIESLLQSNG